MKNILVTGTAGYIGSILARQLLGKGYYVRGLDRLMFGGESLVSIYNHPQFEFMKGDIRNENDCRQAISDMDAVVHLAAIVGDPACAKEPDLARETNWVASKLLFDLCETSNHIQRFIFASTCSNYGKMESDGYVTEESPLCPVSLYAELKVKFEKYILKSQTRPDFIPTSLRFSTAYGLSSRIRFDLTVNEFVRELTMGRELLIFGEQFWRPYC
ncbi:MAG: SDR family NAD-dependent epimerase/dehydratase, partial [Gemmatimonadetes bacterium]